MDVVSEDLLLSAAAVDSYTTDFWDAQALAGSRVDSAVPYLPNLAAAALAAKTAEWQAATAALTERLNDNAVALRTSGVGYDCADEANAQVIRHATCDVRWNSC